MDQQAPILTPALAAKKLDAFGTPRHLEARREVTVLECRRFLKHTDQRHRIRLTAKHLRLSEATVAAVWRRMVTG